jgi:predicted alpha/beta hydrolase family esterase
MLRQRILLLPGLDNSGRNHWQSLWEILQPFHGAYVERIKHSSWSEPVLTTWIQELEQALSVEQSSSTIIVAHSLGCLNVVGAFPFPSIKGALLVAPPNVNRPDFPARIKGFRVPSECLRFPSILVASENDPYSSLEWSRSLSTTLGSEFINIGPAGHVNADSNLGEWKQGQALVQDLLRLAK